MTTQTRITLKNFFKDGELPNAQHYSDLIESSVNRIDDGFDKTEKYGLRISSQGSSTALISFGTIRSEKEPLWTIARGKLNDSLHFRPYQISSESTQTNDDDPQLTKAREQRAAQNQTDNEDAHLRKVGEEKGNRKQSDSDDTQIQKMGKQKIVSTLSLDNRGYVGIHKDNPKWQLDVDGVVRSSGRVGTPKVKDVILANGIWQDITEPLMGCHAFEIMAGVSGKEKSGRHSLLRATAMNAFHPGNWIMNLIFSRRKIRTQSAIFGRMTDRIRLRWKSVPANKNRRYKLQMKTASNFIDDESEDNYVIRYYITDLWFDQNMDECRIKKTQTETREAEQKG